MFDPFCLFVGLGDFVRRKRVSKKGVEQTGCQLFSVSITMMVISIGADLLMEVIKTGAGEKRFVVPPYPRPSQL